MRGGALLCGVGVGCGDFASIRLVFLGLLAWGEACVVFLQWLAVFLVTLVSFLGYGGILVRFFGIADFSPLDLGWEGMVVVVVFEVAFFFAQANLCDIRQITQIESEYFWKFLLQAVRKKK